MKYGKVFKKLYEQNYNFKLVPYDCAPSNYSDLIRKQKQKGFRQVLFNVELMLELVNATYSYPDLYLQKVKMCSDAEENVQAEIDDLVLESRLNRELIFKIIDELEWYSDRESIDIFEIHFYDKQNLSKTVLKSNGIVYGNEIDSLFQEFIYPQLMRYFDEG